MKRFHPEDGPASQRLSSLGDKAKPKDSERSKLACDQCRKRKLKCTNARPCESCRSKLLPCTVSGSSRPPGRPRNLVPIDPNEQPILPPHPNDSAISIQPVSVPDPWTPSAFVEPGLDSSLMSGIAENGISNDIVTYPNAIDLSPSGMVVQAMNAEGVPDVVPDAGGPVPMEVHFQHTSMPMHQIWEDIDMIDDLLPQAYPEYWLTGLDDFSTVDDIWPLTFLPDEITYNSPMETAVEMMKDHLHRRSRAPSPSRDVIREEQKRSWYSAPPQLYIYDEEVINVLLNLARIHISSTFALFADFEALPTTRVELCLAMAAVGGLYCTAAGGVKVAKKLFNDSRRLLLEEYLQGTSISNEDALSFAKTFILLEIYGGCSGDKRAYEFIEVFHASKLHVIKTYMNTLPQDARVEAHRQPQLLAEAIQILDSYRVVLMQQPPSFALEPNRIEFPNPSYMTTELSKPQESHSSSLISLLNPGNQLAPDMATMHNLTSIICYSWQASLHDLESTQPSLWKVEFIELALNSWIQAKTRIIPATPEASSSSTSSLPSHTPPLELPQMLLFHLTHVALHSNLRSLQLLTQETARSVFSSQEGGDVPASVKAWRNSPNFETAHWHARTILRLVQAVLAPPRRFSYHSSHEKDRQQPVEPPHLPLCVYFATLILWYGEVASSVGGDADFSAGDAAIEAGSQLLFRLKVHVSKQLGNALCELRSDGGMDEA